MLHIVPKWKIVIDRQNAAPMEFAISDDHASNVLRDLAKMDFGREVIRITVTLERP